MADTSRTLEWLLAETGLTAGPRIREFTRLATAVPDVRHGLHASSCDTVTRSTALWTLMELDRDIKEALETNGLDAAALGVKLSIDRSPPPIDVDATALHDYLARALQTYLATAEVGGCPFDLPDSRRPSSLPLVTTRRASCPHGWRPWISNAPWPRSNASRSRRSTSPRAWPRTCPRRPGSASAPLSPASTS